MPHLPVLALLGATASGKTEAGIAIALALDAEVVSVDSMLVYRGMDVGTAKPGLEQRAAVPHHLVDLADPSEAFSVARYQSLARLAMAAIEGRSHRVLLVSGGGLYYRSVVDGLEFPGTEPDVRRLIEAEAEALGPEALYGRLAAFDPEAAGRIDPRNARRTVRALEVAAITGRPFSSFARAWARYPVDAVRAAGVAIPRHLLQLRIERRVEAMMPGLLRETEQLLERGFQGFLTSTRAIGYAESVACLEGRMSGAEAVAATTRRTRALARRQLAWLRKDPRIRWFQAGEEGAPGIVDGLVQYLGGERAAPVAAGSGRKEQV